MGIFLRCKQCKSDHKLETKICSKCGNNLSSNKRYKVAVKTKEGKRIVRTVDTLTLAKKVENSLKGKVAEEKILNIKQAPLINEIWDQYAKWAKDNKKSWRHDLGRWKWHVAPHVNSKYMDQLSRYDIENIISNMKKVKAGFKKNQDDEIYEVSSNKHKPSTKKQVLVLIRRFYNWALERELYHGTNPASKIKAPKLNNQITECLTPSQLDNLLNVLSDWKNRTAALIVKFALFTGLRLDEIIGMEWKDVDLSKRFIKLIDPKGNPVTLPICNEAVQICIEAQKVQSIGNCPFVFPNNKGQRRVSFGKIWSRIRKRANIPSNFRFHGLRHTFASYLASSGQIDIYTLQKLLNHQTPEMTQRYAHLLDEALRRGANIADHVFNTHK